MPRIRVPGYRAPKETLPSKNTAQFKIGLDQLAGTYARRDKQRRAENNPFKLPAFPPAVVPAKASGMAMDDSLSSTAATAWAAQQTIDAIWSEGLQFLGYTYLSEIAQRAEYRVMSEVIAEEMTRKWIRLQARGDEDKSEKISELKDYLDNMRLQAVFYDIARLDGLMGRSHIYIDTGSTDDGAELKTAIGNGRDDVSKSKLKKGILRAFKVIEPIWAYPTDYNASDPLADNWYRPDQWYAMSRSIHRSRFLTFVGRPVPDLLKPSYAFGGLSLSQMAKPYVDNWLRTRQSVSDLVHSFTVFKLATDMSALMADQGDQLFRRMELFNNLRDNSNLFLHDKETETFENVSAPLGTLDSILNKSQEQMCTVARIPVVKLLGIQAMGLNASSEGELTAFYDTIEASQERLFRPNLTTCIDFAQLSLWGEVDEDIVFEFEPLRALDRKQEAEVRKTEAETGQILVSGGVISPEEERIRISSDPDSMYDGLDPNDVPDLQEEEEGGLVIPGGGGAEKAVLEGAGGEGGEGDKPKPGSDKPKPKNDKPKDEGAKDSAFNEADHPRKDDGKFGSGGGSAGEATKEGEPPKPKSPKAAERIKGAATWLKTAAVEKVLTGDNIKSAAAVGIKSALYHGLQFDDAMMGVIEEYIHLQVKHVSETTAASQAMIRKAMLSVTDSLINLRMIAKDSDEESDDDPILAVLKKIKAALDGMDIAEDSEFKEGDHPREPDGKFGSGSGGASSSKPSPKPERLNYKSAGARKGDPTDAVVNTRREIPRPDMEQERSMSAEVAKRQEQLEKQQAEERRKREEQQKSGAPVERLGYKSVGMRRGDSAEDDRPTNVLANITAMLAKPAEDAKGDLVETEEDVYRLDGVEGVARPEDWEGEEPIIAGDAAEFKEGDHPREKGGPNAGQFTKGSGGGSSGAAAGSAEKKKEDRPPKPKLPDGVKSKKEHIGNLLKKGVTAKEILEATGWPSVSMPQVAKSLGLELIKKKEGRVFRYFGVEKNQAPPEEIKPPEVKPPPPPVKHKRVKLPPPVKSFVKGAMSVGDIKKNSDAVAAKLKFNANKITVETVDKEFVLNGRTFFYAGGARLSTGEIFLYKNQVSEASLDGIVAHEIEHHKFQSAIDTANVERMDMMREPGPPPDPNGATFWERRGGKDAVMAPDGTLRPAYAKKYPVYTAMQKALDSVPIEKFEIGDGVSAYSLEYWQEYKKGTISRIVALHETLAEMARVKLETGKLPEPLGPRITSYLNQGVPKRTVLESQMAWRTLYRTVDKVWGLKA